MDQQLLSIIITITATTAAAAAINRHNYLIDVIEEGKLGVKLKVNSLAGLVIWKRNIDRKLLTSLIGRNCRRGWCGRRPSSINPLKWKEKRAN